MILYSEFERRFERLILLKAPVSVHIHGDSVSIQCVPTVLAALDVTLPVELFPKWRGFLFQKLVHTYGPKV